jgi:hypothetical protein
MPISAPDKIITPWATSGLKATIPETADPVLGRAGYDQGFPAINMTPKTAGGIAPFGQDFNGIFLDVTKALQFMQAGGTFPYDSTWATAVGGYPVGALVSRTDNQGLWRNTVANNLTDPETGGAGWQPEGSGLTSVAMASSNVTLTPLQAARGIIVITGTLTANLQLIFPAYVKSWTVANAATGAFTVTCKTAAGTGVDIGTGQTTQVYGGGTNILAGLQGITGTLATETVAGIAKLSTQVEAIAGTNNTTVMTPLKVKQAITQFAPNNTLATETVAGIATLSTQGEAIAGTSNTTVMTPLKVKQAITQFDFLNKASVTVTASGTINLTTGAPNTSQLSISGTGVNINGFTVAAHRFFVVRMTGSNTLVHSVSLLTGRGANIPVVAGDSFLMRSTAANTVEILCGNFVADAAVGTRGQTRQNVKASRAGSTAYTNTTGRPFEWNLAILDGGGTGSWQLTVGGITYLMGNPPGGTNTFSTVVLPGEVYGDVVLNGNSIQSWTETRT